MSCNTVKGNYLYLNGNKILRFSSFMDGCPEDDVIYCYE